MAPRALGALLALVAAIAFVVSVASSSWWTGHPSVDGHTITAKAVRVGLLGATGCNTGGDGRCQSVEVGGGFQTAGLVELGAIGLATVLAFMLAVSAWRIGDRRRQLAALMLFVASLSTIGAIGVIAIGPALRAAEHVTLPIGWGVYVFGGGILSALAASLITRKLEPEPLRLKSSSYAPLAMTPNVRDMLRDQHDGLRPGRLGPEPMLGPSGSTSQQPRVSAPLIGGAPQLRPLYESEGFVPGPVSPNLPVSPPTPVPKSLVDALQGNTTPPPEPVAPRLRPPTGAPIRAANAESPSLTPRTPNPDAPSPFPRTPNPAAPSPFPRTPNPSSAPPMRGPDLGSLASQSPVGATTPPGSGPSGAPRPGSPSSAPPLVDDAGGGPAVRFRSPSTAPPMGNAGGGFGGRSGTPSSAPPTGGDPVGNPMGGSAVRFRSPSTAPPMSGARSGAPSSSPPMRGARSGAPSSSPPMSGARSGTPSSSPPTSGARSGSPSSSPPMGGAAGGARFGSPSDGPPTSGPRSGAPSSSPPMGGAGGARSGAPSSSPPMGGAGGARSGAPSSSPPMGGAGGARSGAPSSAPPMGGAGGARSGAPSSSPPMGAGRAPGGPRSGTPSAAPPVRPSVPMPARTTGGNATAGNPGGQGQRTSSPSVSPPMRASQNTMEGRSTKAHTVPPMPTADNTALPATLSERDAQAARMRRAATDADDRLDQGTRPTDNVTAVEIDALAKAQARAEQDRELRTDPSVPALGGASSVGDATETNLHILPEAESSAITPPPGQISRAPVTGEEPSIARPVTLELAAQTVLSDAAAMRISDEMAAQAPDEGDRPRTTHEMTAQASIDEMQRPRTTFEMGAQTTIGASDPLAGDSIPPRGSLSAELAAQQVDSEGGETDPSRRSDTDVSRRVGDLGDPRERTPMPTHAARGADHTPIPTKERPTTLSTAPANLKPPKATEVAASGPTPACPQCESPMAWVEEHLRFYCNQCRMYF